MLETDWPSGSYALCVLQVCWSITEGTVWILNAWDGDSLNDSTHPSNR